MPKGMLLRGKGHSGAIWMGKVTCMVTVGVCVADDRKESSWLAGLRPSNRWQLQVQSADNRISSRHCIHASFGPSKRGLAGPNRELHSRFSPAMDRTTLPRSSTCMPSLLQTSMQITFFNGTGVFEGYMMTLEVGRYVGLYVDSTDTKLLYPGSAAG